MRTAASVAVLLAGCVHAADAPKPAAAPMPAHPHVSFPVSKALDEILRAAPSDFRALYGAAFQGEIEDSRPFPVVLSNVQLPDAVSRIELDPVLGTSFVADYDSTFDELRAQVIYADAVARVGRARPKCCRLSAMSSVDPDRTVFVVTRPPGGTEELAIVVELDREPLPKRPYTVRLTIGAAR